MDKSKLLGALSAFARQRPGLEFGNYGDVSAYRSELRSITKSLHNANELLAAVSWRDGITADSIIKATQRAYSGRLSIDADGSIDYCTGQYWPTEYRNAVCAVLAECLWHYWLTNGEKPMDAAKRELSRGAVSRWFN